MKSCVICLEESFHVSQCKTCKPSGTTCHRCDKLWFNIGQNALKCLICNKLSKINVRLDCIKNTYYIRPPIEQVIPVNYFIMCIISFILSFIIISIVDSNYISCRYNYICYSIQLPY